MSTTTESQPQRAMLSAEAELGMPSQPLTATPPFFQRVLSLFSRKAVSPVELCFGPTMDMADRRGQCDVALDPPCKCAGISRSFPFRRRGGASSRRVTYDAEQEKGDAA